jgi:hypothetical protein
MLQPIQNGNVTTIIIDCENNESIESSIALPVLSDPQKLGSAITYFRRYTLQSLLSLMAEDDDGNKASRKDTLSDERFTNALQAIADGKATKESLINNFTLTANQLAQLK